MLADARAAGGSGADYVAAQAYAVALVATRCLELEPRDPLWAARRLRTSTFFGAFELDPEADLSGHRRTVIRWKRRRRRLLASAEWPPASLLTPA